MAEETKKGHLHPLSQMIWQTSEIFRAQGFSIIAGPEAEEEFYNFDALNIPADHPARAMQDTFWLKPLEKRQVLRTHMTAADTHYLKTHEPPFRILAPGRVYRNEATDATHEAQFYQTDGLVVEENVNLGHLKGMLENYYRAIFGQGLEFRWRPSYFSFVEPGLELDIKWKDHWLEVVGCGMLHPNVFTLAGKDPKKWKGLAFGGAVDRLAMIKYSLPDIRLLYQGDIRFLNQF